MKTLKQKQAEAIERQKIYDSLTLHKKIKLVKSRPGNAEKELERLNQQLLEEQLEKQKKKKNKK